MNSGMIGPGALRRALISAAPLTVLAFLAIALVGVTSVAEAAPRAFSERWSENIRGDITYAGNTLMSCDPTVSANCEAQRASPAGDNNNVVMFSLDVDGDPGTESSTRAMLDVPAGASVEFAGLYWGGLVPLAWEPTNEAERDEFLSIMFQTPADGSYQPVTGQQFDNVATGNLDVWQGFADVTELVQDGGEGEYTVADVPLQEGPVAGAAGFGGWTLVVAYEAPGDSWRNLTVFDGFAIAPPAVNIPLSGFVTPPSGAFGTKLGFHTFEGDASFANDRVRLNGTALSDAINPANNMLNSRISRLGVDPGGRTPNFLNQLGYDSKIIDASGILANGATSADVLFGDPADLNWPGLITTSIDLFAPDVTASKEVANLDRPGEPARPGETLEYTISYANAAEDLPDDPVDAASEFVISDAIPAGTTYVPGSLEMISGDPAPPGARTDAAGDDSAEYDGIDDEVVFRAGAGADATDGGTVTPGEEVTASFEVTVDDGLAGGTIDNTTVASFRAVTLDEVFEASAQASIGVAPTSDLAVTKTAPATADVGDQITYEIEVTNNGPSDSDPTILTDTLPANLSYVSDDANCDTNSLPTITCDLGPLASGTSTSVEIVGEVEPAAESSVLENSADVSGPNHEPDLTNNSATAQTQVPPLADLSLVKSAVPSAVVQGRNITYTLEVANAGPTDSDPTIVTDGLWHELTLVSATPAQGTCDDNDPITCDLGLLAAGEQTTIEIVARVAPNATGEAGGIPNTAEVSGPIPDPNTDNNSSSTNTRLLPAKPRLAVNKRAGKSSAKPGSVLAYKITVRNKGKGPARKVRVCDRLPAGQKLLRAQGADKRSAKRVCWKLGRLKAGAKRTFRVVTQIKPSAKPGVQRNKAIVNARHAKRSRDNAKVRIRPAADTCPARAVWLRC